jgi:hypothetical protein
VLAWQWLFAAVTGAPLGWAENVVVGSSVWLAYAADRWLETWLVPKESLVTPRHRFYARFRGLVLGVWIAMLVVDVVVAFSALTRRELTAGVMLLAPTVLYVLSHQFAHRHIRWRLPKEICIAVLIAGGASVFVAAGTQRWIYLAAPVVLFAAVCFSNVALIGVWEADIDRSQGQTSLAHQFSSMATFARVLPFIVAGLAVMMAAPDIGVAPVPAHCVAASAMMLALLDRFEAQLGWRLARVLADAALLTPLLPLIKTVRP